MISRKLFTTILIPSAAIVTEAKDKENEGEFKCKASELPIYTPEKGKPVQSTDKQPAASTKPNFIEKSFATVRIQIFTVIDQVKYVRDRTEDIVNDSIHNADSLIKYLSQEDSDQTHKMGAIAVGGLAGLILGLRGGLFRRTLFTGVGAAGMASICYPKEAAEYSEYAMEEAKKYGTIGYNFIYGVTKDDPPLQLPTFPTSISGVWDLVTGNTKAPSVSEAVNEEIKK